MQIFFRKLSKDTDSFQLQVNTIAVRFYLVIQNLSI